MRNGTIRVELESHENTRQVAKAPTLRNAVIRRDALRSTAYHRLIGFSGPQQTLEFESST